MSVNVSYYINIQGTLIFTMSKYISVEVSNLKLIINQLYITNDTAMKIMMSVFQLAN